MTAAIEMTTTAWDTIRQEVTAESGGLETGGILLGHDRGNTLQITIAGGPGPNAVRSPDRFLRDREHAEQLAAQAWENDRAQWVGEWHTHPTTPPMPSPIDLTSYTRHLDDPDLNFDRFVSVIIGRDDRQQTVVAGWVITSGDGALVPLSIGEATMTEPAKFDHTDPVFVSYRHSDGTPTTAELAWLLRAAGIPVWRDVDDLPPGDTEERLKQAMDAGLSGAVLVITPDVEHSRVIGEVEAPRLISLHQTHREFALGIVNAVETQSGSVDYEAPDRVLRLSTESLAGVDQKPSTREGLIALIRGMVFHRIAQQRLVVEQREGTFNLTVQTRNTPQVYDRTGSELDIRVRPSDHEKLPSARGLIDLADVIKFLPDAVTRASAKRVTINGGAHLSVALALGMALPASRLGHIEVVDQRGWSWKSDGISRMPDAPNLAVASTDTNPQSTDSGRARVAVYLDLMSPRSDSAFRTFLDANRHALSAWTHLRHVDDEPLDPKDATELAAEAAHRIRELSSTHDNAEVDLMVRGPFPMAVLVGYLLNTVRVVAHEWDDTQRPTYVPTLRLLASSPGGVIREVLI